MDDGPPRSTVPRTPRRAASVPIGTASATIAPVIARPRLPSLDAAPIRRSRVAPRLDDRRRRRSRVPRRRRRRDRRQRRARPAEIAAAMADQAAALAYAHGSAFTTEPLEAYAAEVGADPAGRRPGDLPGVRRLGGHRDGPQARPCLPPRPRRDRSRGRHRAAGAATTATRSARWTCPGARRCAGRTSRGSAGSGTCPRRTRTARASPARTPSATPRPSPPSWSGHRRGAGRDASRRSSPSRSSGPRSPPPSRPTTTGRPIAEVCRRHGVLLIADEVMTGFGRTGRWFALDHWGVRPDILVAAKGATSGYWPFGFVAASGAVHDDGHRRAGAGFVHGFTYSHAPVGAAVAREVLRILETSDLVEASAAKGERLQGAAARSLGDHPARRRDPRPRPAGRARARRGPGDPRAVPARRAAHRGRRRAARASAACSSTRGPATPTARTATRSCSARRSSITRRRAGRVASVLAEAVDEAVSVGRRRAGLTARAR